MWQVADWIAGYVTRYILGSQKKAIVKVGSHEMDPLRWVAITDQV